MRKWKEHTRVIPSFGGDDFFIVGIRKFSLMHGYTKLQVGDIVKLNDPDCISKLIDAKREAQQLADEINDSGLELQ